MTTIFDDLLDKINDERIEGREPVLIFLHPADFIKLKDEMERTFKWLGGRKATLCLHTFCGLRVVVTHRIKEGKALVIPKETLEIILDIYMKHYRRNKNEIY